MGGAKYGVLYILQVSSGLERNSKRARCVRGDDSVVVLTATEEIAHVDVLFSLGLLLLLLRGTTTSWRQRHQREQHLQQACQRATWSPP